MTDNHFTDIETALEFINKAMSKCDQPTVSVEYTCQTIKTDLLVAKTQLLAVLTDTMREDISETPKQTGNEILSQERYT